MDTMKTWLIRVIPVANVAVLAALESTLSNRI